MAAAALFIGAGLQAYGAYQSGQEKQAAYEAEAANKRAQAAQIQIGSDHEIDLTRQHYDKVGAAQRVAFGQSGVSGATGSPLLQMENTAANAVSDINTIRNAANYKSSSLLTEGLYDQKLGGEAMDAAYLNVLSAGVGAVAKNPYTYDAPRRANQSQGGQYGG